MGVGIVSLISLGVLVLSGVLWFIFEEYLWEYDFADAFVEFIFPALMILSGVIFVITGVVSLVDLVESETTPEKVSKAYVESRAEIVDELSVNPFDNNIITKAIDWNSELEKNQVDDEERYYEDLEKIDYINYQRKYAKDKLGMVPKEGIEIIDETVIEIKKEDLEKLKEYIKELETELDNKNKNTTKEDASEILKKYG